MTPILALFLSVLGQTAAAPPPDPLPVIPPVTLSEAAWTPVPVPGYPIGVVAHGTDLWAFGAREMIMVSRDQGHTWTVRHLNLHGEIVFSLAFPTDRDVYALGSGGLFLTSSDAGASWAPQKTNVPSIVSAHFVDALRGAAVFDNAVLFTEDAGRHWKSHAFADGAQVGSLAMIDAGHFAVLFAPDGEHWSVASTANGGRHFDSVPVPGGLDQVPDLSVQNGRFVLRGPDKPH